MERRGGCFRFRRTPAPRSSSRPTTSNRRRTIADAVRAAAGPGFTTNTWIELNKPLFSALKLEKLALFLTISLIVFVASLNIVTTLIMMVLEKQGDIAILTAMGASSRVIMHVFMLQGLIIGVIGTTLGATLGVGSCWVLNTYKLIRLQAEVYSIPYVPFHVKGLGRGDRVGDGAADQLPGDPLPGPECVAAEPGGDPAL